MLNIQRFCTDDGPGIRTTVFLKGCPLRCVWCHNPESQAKRCELTYNTKKCVACGRCVSACPYGCHALNGEHTFESSRCSGCGICAQACPTGALELYGQCITVDEAFDEVKKDKIFYETSGGGVTISGGEPLSQPDFTAELLQMCKGNGIHTAIETCGFCDEKTLRAVIRYCDLILFDIKETDEELHRQYTGVSLEPILNSLNIINASEKPFILRAPIVPTLNDRASHFEALRTLRASLEFCRSVQIMPYHSFGSYKYELLSKKYSLHQIPEPTKEMIDAWSKLI